MSGLPPTRSDGPDRGQAYTLEGFIGAMVVLLAVLFALQSVVISPTTGGLSDRSVQAQIEQETQDALVVSNQDGNLSELVRNWDGSGGFEGTSQPSAPGEDNETYSADQFANESVLGRVLQDRFGENGWDYNVELHPETGDQHTLVYQGSPPPDALSASYTIALYDDQTITADWSNDELHEVDPDQRTISRAHGGGTVLYNVVEVRVILW